MAEQQDGIPAGHNLSVTLTNADEADWDTGGQRYVVVYAEARDGENGISLGDTIRDHRDGRWLGGSLPGWAERELDVLLETIDPSGL